ncbi:MAG TPA: divalent metal cation transporter, partial [Candidatus Baltobacteraceae bacterium]|nr:divalent metal cation transporter [Candidatus Baltobacteraceae bacterium]
AQIFGVPPAPLVILAAALLAVVIFTASYKRAEVFALALCAIELCFIPAAFAAKPPLHAIVMQGLFGSQPLGNQAYLLLIASNIGAVIMPWMIFYQQSAVVDKGLTQRDINYARLDTALGSVLTQAIMCAIVVTTAATLFVRHIPVTDAAHAAMALQPLVGKFAGITFGAGLIGASMLGAFVVSLATAWAFGEAFGWRCSLNDGLRAKRFIALYLACVIVAAGIVLVPGIPLVTMTVYVEAFNGFVLPIVLGFLLVLVNDRNVIGERRNGVPGNAIAFALSAVIVGLGLWMMINTVLHPGGT